jgi:hypothetical protein
VDRRVGGYIFRNCKVNCHAVGAVQLVVQFLRHLLTP